MRLHKHKYKLIGKRTATCYSIWEGYSQDIYDVYECEICKKLKYKLKETKYPSFDYK